MTGTAYKIISGIMIVILIFLLSARLSTYELIQIGASVVGLLIAYSIYCVAKSSLKNAEMQRKQRHLENKLKDVYSPLFQIFSIAKNIERRDREVVGSFRFINDEYPKIKEIYRYHSYDIDEKLRKQICKKIIEEPDTKKRVFTPDELDSVFEDIKRTYFELKQELQNY